MKNHTTNGTNTNVKSDSGLDQDDREEVLNYITEATEFADRLIGRAVAIVADSGDPPSPEAARDQVEIAHLAGMLRCVLLGARAIVAPSNKPSDGNASATGEAVS